MERSKFRFTVYIETPWQIDEDAAANYLRIAIEDSVLGVGVKPEDIYVVVQRNNTSSEVNNGI